MLRFVVFFAFLYLGYVEGHALLLTPPAWNNAASKTNPCGGGKFSNTSAATWVIGQQVTLTWRVQAGDGSGAVTVTLDPAGTAVPVAATFTATGTQTVPTNPNSFAAVGTYSMTMTVPSITCAGPGRTCTMQVKSSSNWFSCATVTITAAPPTSAPTAAPTGGATRPPTTTAPTSANCQVASGLKYCTEVNGKSVSVYPGQSPLSDQEGTIAATFQSSLSNPEFFRNPNNTQCLAVFKAWLCADGFPVCGTPYGRESICQTTCLAIRKYCDVHPIHDTYFDCDKTANATDFDNVGTCPLLSSINAAGSVASSFQLLVGLLVFVVASLF